MEDRWLSVDEIAAHLGVKRDTVYRWIQRGNLPAHRVGRLWKFRRTEIDDWVQRSGSDSRSPRPVAAAKADDAPVGDATELLTVDPKVAEIVRRLVDAYDPEQIFLFGSKARGESGPDSDYDLLVVVPDDASPERGRSRLAYERLWGTGAAADVIVWRRSEFDARLHIPSSLPATVTREGVVLHAA